MNDDAEHFTEYKALLGALHPALGPGPKDHGYAVDLDRQCGAKTKHGWGHQCRNPALLGQPYCFIHFAELAQEEAIRRSRARRAVVTTIGVEQSSTFCVGCGKSLTGTRRRVYCSDYCRDIVRRQRDRARARTAEGRGVPDPFRSAFGSGPFHPND